MQGSSSGYARGLSAHQLMTSVYAGVVVGVCTGLECSSILNMRSPIIMFIIHLGLGRLAGPISQGLSQCDPVCAYPDIYIVDGSIKWSLIQYCAILKVSKKILYTRRFYY